VAAAPRRELLLDFAGAGLGSPRTADVIEGLDLARRALHRVAGSFFSSSSSILAIDVRLDVFT